MFCGMAENNGTPRKPLQSAIHATEWARKQRAAKGEPDDLHEQDRDAPQGAVKHVNRGRRLAASVAQGAAGPAASRFAKAADTGQADNAAEQAVNDAAKVAATVASRAAVGNLPGAAVSGLVTAARSTTGKKVAIGCASGAAVIALIVTTALGGLGGSSSTVAADTFSADGFSLVAARDTVESSQELETIRRTSTEYGVPWQVVASVWYTSSKSNITGGTGPFKITDESIGDGDDQIPKSDALNLEPSARFVASAVAAGFNKHVAGTAATTIDAGVTDGTGDDGKRKRELGGSDRDVAAQEASKDAWVAAIRELPVAGIDAQAEAVHSVALTWMMGETPSMCLDTSGAFVGGGVATNVGSTTLNLDQSQVTYAQSIINRVAERNMPQQAAVVALATVMQESMLRMYWNPKVPGSRELAPDPAWKGVDGYSVGLFQQQVRGNTYAWGTVKDAMDPAKSTDMFLNALQKVKGWESLPVTVAAQRVQVSAHPEKYAKWEGMARQLVKDLPPTSGWSSSDHDHDDVVDSGSGSASGELTTQANPHGLRVDTSLRPDVQLVQAAVVSYFGPAVYAMGGYRAGSVGHSQRIATDLMITDYKSSQGKAAGDALADFLITNRDALGVDYLIWRDRIWLGPTTGWQPYSTGGFGKHLIGRGWDDTTLHHDHIHVETFGSSGTGGKLVGGDGAWSVGGNQGVGAGCNAGGMAGTSPFISLAGAPFMGQDDYPHRDPVGDCSWCAGSRDPGADAWGMYKRECVSFVAWRMNQLMGWQPGQPYPFTKATMKFNGSANARYWGKELAEMGYKVDMVPAVGAIAWWDAWENKGYPVYGMGHVAVVLQVNGDGTVLVEQYNGSTVAGSNTKSRYSQITVPASSVTGYIHVADLKTDTPPQDGTTEGSN